MKVQVLAGLMACSLSVANAQVIFFDDFDAVASGNGDTMVFADGQLAPTVNFNGFTEVPEQGGYFGNSATNATAQIVDTTAGTLTLTSPGNFLTSNRFTVGGITLAEGDTVRFTTELSFEIVNNVTSLGAFFFGFRGGAGGGEFQPNDGVAHTIDYNQFANDTSNGFVQFRTFANNGALPGNGNITTAAVGLGPGLAGDTVSDFFRISTEATLNDLTTGELNVRTFVTDLNGDLLSDTILEETVIDTGIRDANGAIVFAVRDANAAFESVVINSLSAEILVDGVEGDLNGDGSVGGADYTLFRDFLGSADPTADITGATLGSGPDGIVDGNDLAVVTSNFGAPVATVGSLNTSLVPEPTSLALIMTFGVAALRRNRK